MSDKKKEKPSLRRVLPPDDPIYTRGFVIGQKRTGIVSRTEGAFHGEKGSATIIFGYHSQKPRR